MQTKQLELQTNLAKAANTQALVGLSSPFNIELVKDPQMAKFWVEGVDEFENYSKVDKYRYKTLLIWWLILHENVYYQKQKGLLDDAIYLAWEYDLKHFVERQKLQRYWEGMENFFQKDFNQHVNQIMQEVEKEQASLEPDDTPPLHSAKKEAHKLPEF